MSKAVLAILSLTVIWTAFSWQWYTCGIKGFCGQPELEVTITRQAAAGTDPDAERAGMRCQPFITKHMAIHRVNDTEEVQKLNYFLSTFEGLPVTAASAVFNQETLAAVRTFQVRHQAVILEPYGLTAPTGNVYTKTIETINGIYCAQ